MIIGLNFWNDENTYHIQDNNGIENIIRKSGRASFLETCGCTVAVNILAARGDNIEIKCPGTAKMQPEDFLAVWFNDPNNQKTIESIRKLNYVKMFGNRVPQLYPKAIMECFGVKACFSWGLDFTSIMKYLQHNIGVMVCLKKPSHFIGLVAVDFGLSLVFYNDPWSNNYWPHKYRGKSGFNRVLPSQYLLKNLEPYRILIGTDKE